MQAAHTRSVCFLQEVTAAGQASPGQDSIAKRRIKTPSCLCIPWGKGKPVKCLYRQNQPYEDEQPPCSRRAW